MPIFTLKRRPVAAVDNDRKIGVAAAAGDPYIGNFMTYTTGFDRQLAIQIPTVSRARDLICSMVSCLEIRQYARQWVDEDYVDIELPDDTWFQQPDPNVTRNFII